MKAEDNSRDSKQNEPITIDKLLSKWDGAIVDLNRNQGMFKFDSVRLRDCSLYFSKPNNEYYVRYRNVTFGLFDIYNCR